MVNSALVSILFFALIQKIAFSFTFQICSDYPLDETVTCDDYSEEDFSLSTLQNSPKNYIYIDLTGTSEMILNIEELSGITSYKYFYFINVDNSQLTIQTMDTINTGYYKHDYLNIYAYNIDVYIDNINEENNASYISLRFFSYKTIGSKNPSKPLYIMQENTLSTEYSKPNDFRDELTFIIGNVQLEETLTKSLTICGRNINIDDYGGLIYTYGKDQIIVEYPDKKTITFKGISDVRITVKENSIITCEDGLSKFENIIPWITSSPYNSITNLPTITGNWPKIRVEDCDNREMRSHIQGVFLYSANYFPISTHGELELILTNAISSVFINFIYNNDNITLSTKDNVETIFHFLGRSFNIIKTSYADPYLITKSSKITVIASTMSGLQHEGQGQIIYEKIDNSFDTLLGVPNFMNGGNIAVQYGLNYTDLSNRIQELYRGWKKSLRLPF